MTLDETFYEALRDHPVPLLESAIKQLKEKSLALDVYIWLVYRLHSLKQPTPISWASLFAQFGTGFRLSRQFKPYFLELLGQRPQPTQTQRSRWGTWASSCIHLGRPLPNLAERQ